MAGRRRAEPCGARVLDLVPEPQRAAAIDRARSRISGCCRSRGNRRRARPRGPRSRAWRRYGRRTSGRRGCWRPPGSDRPVRERDAHRRERGLVRGRELLDVERGELVDQSAMTILDGGVQDSRLRPLKSGQRPESIAPTAPCASRKSRKIASAGASGLGVAAPAAPIAPRRRTKAGNLRTGDDSYAAGFSGAMIPVGVGSPRQ